MKLRKLRPVLFGVLLALGVAGVCLARPEDELAGLVHFHPLIRQEQEGTEFEFQEPFKEMLAALPDGPPETGHGERMRVYEFELPGGQRADLSDDSPGWSRSGGCTLFVEKPGPWYRQAWCTIKHRLGF